MKSLEKQIAIISGGLGDIGKAIAKKLAYLGADIAIGDILESKKSEYFLQELKQFTQRVRYDQIDISDFNAVKIWVENIENDLGIPTLIIPNAAIVTFKNSKNLNPNEWTHELNVNLNGAFYLAQSAIQRLLFHHKSGRVVFIGSWAGHRPHPFITAYCVGKAGLSMLCKSMALEFAANGILVNEVAPGYVDAGLSAISFRENQKVREECIQQVPTHQLIYPDEVAFEVAHLCDPRNRHITGTTVLMDGGLSLLSIGNI